MHTAGDTGGARAPAAPTRRLALGTGLAALLTGSAAAPPPGDDAELLAACARFHALQRQFDSINATGAPDAVCDELSTAWWPALHAVSDITPVTPAGLIAKVRAVRRACLAADPDFPGDDIGAAVLALLDDVAGDREGRAPA